MLHAASRESPNSTDVVAADPILVPSWDARDVRRLGGLSEHCAIEWRRLPTWRCRASEELC